MITVKKIVVILLFAFSTKLNSQSRIYNFNAIALGDSVRLTFTILQASVTCANYQILKGSDSLTLNPIFVYPGICGSTTSSELHSYTDISPNKVTPNFYQIFIPPNDYSMVKRVDMAMNFSNLIVFPQPVDDVANIVISGQKNYYYEIHIYDHFGRKRFFGNGNATDKISIDVSFLNEGVFTFYIVQSSGNAYRGKIWKKPKPY